MRGKKREKRAGLPSEPQNSRIGVTPGPDNPERRCDRYNRPMESLDLARILFEDPHLIAVNKPAPLLTQAPVGIPNLESLVKAYIKAKYAKPAGVYLGVPHRLDRPVSGVVVTVHRVGPDSSGPLDSVRTKADGRYDIRFMRSGSEEAIYFAATVYSGIAYFSAPIRGEELRGDQAEITVFDTTSRTVPFTVQGHHVVVSAPSA